ncbi:MAG: hypothetical protein MZV63_26655 [Marinilabiliales bacterium]|nr:hypothetical protein [Marinilabiliales bacterium]
METGDWILIGNEGNSIFEGYDTLESKSHIVKYRSVKANDTDFFQVVLDKAPFMPKVAGRWEIPAF